MRESLDIPTMIDDFFQSRIVVNEGGASRRISCFRVILHHLSSKAMANSRKASALLARYMSFAASHGNPGAIEIRIVPDPDDEPTARNDGDTHEQLV
jgi:hypothetical protein